MGTQQNLARSHFHSVRILLEAGIVKMEFRERSVCSVVREDENP
jgi:hypothetical protein